MSGSIDIIIADDHPLIRQGLRTVLERQPDVRIVGEHSNGEDALNEIRTRRPHVAVLDVEMPRMDGFGVVRHIEREGLGTSAIFLTMYREEHIFNKAFDAGVRGYVLKENAVDEIVRAVHTVAEGGFYISPSIAAFLVRRSGRPATSKKEGIATLTTAERTILGLVAEMKTSAQIAEELGIAVKTVNNHRNNIAEKLSLRGTNALLKFALENKSEL